MSPLESQLFLCLDSFISLSSADAKNVGRGEKPAPERPAAVKGTPPLRTRKAANEEAGQPGRWQRRPSYPPTFPPWRSRFRAARSGQGARCFAGAALAHPLTARTDLKSWDREEGKDNFQPTRGHVCPSFTVGTFVKFYLSLTHK